MFTHALILSLVAASGGNRTEPRLRGDIGLAFSAGFSPAPYVGGFSPGIDAAIGATFGDKYGLVARFTGGTIGISTSFAVDLAFELALHEQLFLSAGLGFGAVGGGVFNPDLPVSQFVIAPARLTYMFARRHPEHRTKQGFAIFLELAPGLVVRNAPGAPGPKPPGAVVVSPFAGMGAIGVTYSWK
jgi:hypothetical protein